MADLARALFVQIAEFLGEPAEDLVIDRSPAPRLVSLDRLRHGEPIEELQRDLCVAPFDLEPRQEYPEDRPGWPHADDPEISLSMVGLFRGVAQANNATKTGSDPFQSRAMRVEDANLEPPTRQQHHAAFAIQHSGAVPELDIRESRRGRDGLTSPAADAISARIHPAFWAVPAAVERRQGFFDGTPSAYSCDWHRKTIPQIGKNIPVWSGGYGYQHTEGVMIPHGL